MSTYEDWADSLADDLILNEAAQNVLWYYRDSPNEGWRPSNFVEQLIRAMDAADQANLLLLAKSFPELTGMVYSAKYIPGGLDAIRKIMRGQA